MVAFSLFGWSIYRYGIFYALAFILGYGILWWIGKKGFFSTMLKIQRFLTAGLEDLLLSIAIGVIVGGRLGHVLIYGDGYYFEHWQEIFKIWEGGMSFIGGILWVVSSVGILLWRKKMSRKEFLVLFDVILVVVPLGIFFGRFGNFLNQELYGIAIAQLPTRLSQIFSTFWLVHMYSKVDQVLRVNTNFLSMIFEGLLIFCVQGGIFLRQIRKKQRKVWLLATNFLLMYSGIRFVLEYLRADSQMEIIGFLSKSQRFFVVFVVIGLLVRWSLNSSETLKD